MQMIISIAPTICRLMGVPPPRLSTSDIIHKVIDEAEGVLEGHPVEKCFIYSPDAVGDVLFRDLSEEFDQVIRIAPVRVLLRSVYPPKTPICFASMFSGALPEAHGITRSERPVLSCETIFDVLPRAGKRVAIVSVVDSSISLIFRKRPIDYFIEEYDRQVNDRLIQLLWDDDYDFFLVYNQEYDNTMHYTTPRSEKALRAMRNHLSSFVQLANTFLDRYKEHTRLVLFSPDHGSHLNEETGHGNHGLDIPEDMKVRSFWGIYSIDRAHTIRKFLKQPAT